MKNKILIFKALTGSHSYGTNVENSDFDYKGVYIQTDLDILENGYVPQFSVTKDETYYEVGRFLNLCETGNPTMLELLFTPDNCINFETEIWKVIKSYKQHFLTKKCKLSFGGYAISQIIKAKGLEKKINWDKERVVRKDVLDFCYVHEGCNTIPIKKWMQSNDVKNEDLGLVSLPNMRNCYAMYYDTDKLYDFKPNGLIKNINVNDLSMTSIDKEIANNLIPKMLYFNKDNYSIHCSEYKDYTNWLKNRNVQRYVDIKEHGQKIDGKNLLHCVRLIETGIDIVKHKNLIVKRDNAEYLKSIRHGKIDLNVLIGESEVKIKLLNDLFDNSDLPIEVNPDIIKELKQKIILKYKNVRS